MTQSPQKRMRAKQIALEFGIGNSTVWHYSKLGLLTPIKITNGVTVFDRKEVEALFDGNSYKGVTNE